MDELLGQYQKNLDRAQRECVYAQKTKIHNKIIEDKINLYSTFEYGLKTYAEKEKEMKMKKLLELQKSLNELKQLKENQNEINELNNTTVNFKETKFETKGDQEKIKSNIFCEVIDRLKLAEDNFRSRKESKTERILIYIQMKNTKNQYRVVIDANSTVMELKNQIFQQYGIPLNKIVREKSRIVFILQQRQIER